MRFVWAVAAFVIAAVMIVAGIAQRTVFQGPRTDTLAISVSEDAPYTLIDGAVLTSQPGTQTLRAEGDGTIFVSYGRTADVKAWLASSTYNEVTLAGEGTVSTQRVEPESAASTGSGDAAAATPANPVGSDLWLDEFQQDDLLIAPLQLPASMSVLVASDGTAPAPATVSVSWPTRVATPWAGPLIVGGAVLMLVGVFLYLLAIRHLRRSRGPRRKAPPPLPPTEPIDLAADAEAKGVVSESPARKAVTERRAVRRRRALRALPALMIPAVLLSGCSADAWPQLGGSPSPSASESVIVPAGQQTPAVTQAQAERILDRISSTVAEADQKNDQSVAATRLSGAMLATRETAYTLRGKIADYPAPTAIPAKPLAVVLPQAYDGWPRTVMTIVKDADDSTVPPTIMMMTQQDPWSQYKLTYASSLEAAAVIPDLAPSYVGATQVQPDSKFLIMQPSEVAAAYADVLSKGDDSAYAAMFDSASDQFRVSVAQSRQTRLDEFNKTASTTGALTFSAAAGSHPPMALATIESGAIVGVDVTEADTVKPTNADAVIKLDNNPTVKALTGVDQSSTGFSTSFSDQLFFYVPGQGSTEKIRLLGYATDLLSAQVIP